MGGDLLPKVECVERMKEGLLVNLAEDAWLGVAERM